MDIPEFTLSGIPEPDGTNPIGSLRPNDGSDEWAGQAVSALEFPGVRWVWAGSFTALLSGRVGVPDLPEGPGITRTDRITSDGTVNVLMEVHDSMKSEEAFWDDPDLFACLFAGEQWDVFYLSGNDWPYDSPSTDESVGRKDVVRFIEDEAQCSGRWNLQLVDGQRLLVLSS